MSSSESENYSESEPEALVEDQKALMASKNRPSRSKTLPAKLRAEDVSLQHEECQLDMSSKLLLAMHRCYY
jgi:hypothetical protein